MPGGRPLKFKTAEELQEKIDSYFAMCDGQMKPYTITGLALALDCDRRTLLNYEEKEEFFPTIKKAKLKCENYLEEGMLTGRIPPAAGCFNAKNNYGWKDKTEVEQDVKAEIKVSLDNDLDKWSK